VAPSMTSSNSGRVEGQLVLDADENWMTQLSTLQILSQILPAVGADVQHAQLITVPAFDRFLSLKPILLRQVRRAVVSAFHVSQAFGLFAFATVRHLTILLDFALIDFNLVRLWNRSSKKGYLATATKIDRSTI
jgi:hypothetical protein